MRTMSSSPQVICPPPPNSYLPPVLEHCCRTPAGDQALRTAGGEWCHPYHEETKGRKWQPGGQEPCTPFRFGARRERIDWRLLHGVDVDKLVGGPMYDQIG